MSDSYIDPFQTAERLAAVYGHVLDSPIVYTQGVALSGRLRLFELTKNSNPLAEIERIVRPHLAKGIAMFGDLPSAGGTANYAGICWADEMFDATQDEQYKDLLTSVANLFEPPTATTPIAPPLDADIRVEDFFFAATVLGRAFKATGDERYINTLATFLKTADTQQSDGLWWHCKASPFYWGRGNAFAAMGFAEALTYLPEDHPDRAHLLQSHIRHLESLQELQDKSGIWRQVINRPDSYLEHSASSMIGYTIARGIRLGWLDTTWRSVVDAAWEGVAARIGPNCELEQVCVGTGPQPDLKSYLERPFSDGLDDRGGSMALWFAVEMTRLQKKS